MLKVAAMPHLSSRQFRHGGLYVQSGSWTMVDATEPAIRKVLLGYVGTHVRVYPGQEAELAAAGLELKAGKLSDRGLPGKPKAPMKSVPPKESGAPAKN